MNLNLMEPRLIAPVIEVAVLIAIPIAVFVQKRRKITALLRDRFGAEYDRTFYQHEYKTKSAAKLPERESRVEVL
jgi:hypothetical protein